jgi:O-antigen/teichoic acid export membrane protein
VPIGTPGAQQFDVQTVGGAGGVKLFQLNEDAAPDEIQVETRKSGAMEFASESDWIWDYKEDVDAIPGPTVIPLSVVTRPAAVTGTPPPGGLSPPVFSIPGGQYSAGNFALSVTLTNLNLVGSSHMVIALSAVGLLITKVPVATLFGAGYAKWEPVLMPALWTGVILLAVDLIARHTDRVREGYMEAAVANAWVAAGNLVGAVVVIAGIRYFPSPQFILLVAFLPNILMRLANTVFLLRKRPWLVRPLGFPTRKETGEMLKDGLFFSATTSVVTLVEIKLCGLIIGRILGPSDVAIHFVLMSITTAFSGMLIMVGTPLWAAILDARAKGDREWLAAATRRYYQYLAALAAMAAVALVGFGPFLIPLLYGAEFTAGRVLFFGHALFLFAIGWWHVNRYVAIGLDALPATVAPVLAGLGVGFSLGLFGLQRYGLWALYAGLAIGTLAVAGVLLPRLVWRRIHSTQESEDESEGSVTDFSLAPVK